MFTNDIKKGFRVRLNNGWMGTMMDNKKGNTRMVEVEGYFTEIGSVYAHHIVEAKAPNEDEFNQVQYTDSQINLMKMGW